MGCSDSFAVPVQTGYSQPITNYQQYNTNQNSVAQAYQQYYQDNGTYVNIPNQPKNNTTNDNVNYNTNNTSKVNNVNTNQSNNINTNTNTNNKSTNNTNQVSKTVQKSLQKTTNERIMEDTDDFEFNNYAPIFKSDLLDEEVQTITKVYSDTRSDDDDMDSQGKIHHIYITLNYRENFINIIELERSLSTVYKKHLKLIKIENECSKERVKSYLEKYNEEFGVNSTQWYKKNNCTNIYVKSEIDPDDHINMFEVFYDKSNSNLVFNKKQTRTSYSFNSQPIVANPQVLVQNYNLLKYDYTIDHDPEEMPEINNNNFNKNNNMFNNMMNNFPFGFGNNNFVQSNVNQFFSQQKMQTGIKINQKIEVKLPKNKQRGGYSKRNNDNDSYEDNNSNHSNHSNNSRRSGSFKNRDGMRVGGVDKDGTIRDKDGCNVGKFEDDGTVRDRNNYERAKIEDGVIRDRNGYTKLEYDDGVVKDANGNKLGEIKDGVVKDANGNVIGEVDGGISDGQAAYQHFFKDD